MKKEDFAELLQSLEQALAHALGDSAGVAVRGVASPSNADDMADEYDFPALKEQAKREGRAIGPEFWKHRKTRDKR